MVEATRESLKASTHLPQEENSGRKYLQREQRIDGESPWTWQNRARMGFARFWRFAPPEAFSKVPVRSQIALARAGFERFSEMRGNLGTEVWSRRDLNPGPLNRFCSDNCPRIWRDIRDEIKAAVLQRILSPRIRLALPNLLVLHRHECSSPPRQMISSFPVPEGRTILRYCSDRSCWHRIWRRPKTEIPSGLDFRLRLLTIVPQKFTLR